MQREKITYNQMAEYADASSQAVHKWLSSGSISDEKALKVAQTVGLDWLWLKHGITRIPVESLYEIIFASTSRCILTRWDTFELLALGKQLAEDLEYDVNEVVGQSVIKLTPQINVEDVRKGQKLIYALSNVTDYSWRATLYDKHSKRAIELRGKAHTTDSDGVPYAVESISIVKPNGQEDSVTSFRLHKKSWQPPGDEYIKTLVQHHPELPWLEKFLRT